MNKTLYFILLLISSYHCALSQNSLNMSRVGVFNPPGMPSTPGGNIYNDIWGYTATDGSEYAIIGNADSILVVDVSICNDPQRVYGYDGGNTTIWRDFKTYQNYMYAVCDNCSEGLHIFDMSGLPNGNVNHVLTTTAFFSKAHNIFIDTATHKLYATGGNGAAEGLTILDLSNPTNPTLIDHLEFDDLLGMQSTNFYVHDVYVQNDTAYCSHGYTGFYVWDLTDLNNIDLLGSYDSPGYNHSSWIDATGSYTYYAEEVPRGRPMAVVDLENLGHPVNDIQLLHTFKDPISTVENDVTPHNPFVYEDTLYISYYEDGIKVYDLINPESPTLVAYYDTYPDNGTAYTDYDGNWGTYPFLSSGCILASDVKYGLNTFNVIPCSNPISYYRDADQDTYGDPNTSYTGCAQAEGWVIDNSDCDDTNSEINPAAPEICDDTDSNCDGITDNIMGQVDGSSVYYLDNDNDGYGSNASSIRACSQPTGYVIDNTDCNDNNPNINPGSIELCDSVDNNCNNITDENCPLEPCDAIHLYINPATQNVYYVKQTIDSDATISSNQDIEYNAGQSIDLDQGFEVVLGAEFLAQIKDCDDSQTIIQGPAEALHDHSYEGVFSDLYRIELYINDQLIKQFINKSELNYYIRNNDIEDYKIKISKK